MRVLVVHNPVSGSRVKNARDIPSLVKQFLTERGVSFEWLSTSPEPLSEALRACCKTHFDRIIAIGGDGTVREIADFLISNHLTIPMGIVPQGSGNVLALALKIPLFSLRRCLMLALEGKPRPLDVMRVNNRLTALIATGQGYDTIFVPGATRKMKRFVGIIAYVISFLRTIVHCRKHSYEVTIDGVSHHLHGVQAEVFNTLPLSGIVLRERISPCDGLLDVVIFNPKSLLEYSVGLARCLTRRGRWTPHVSIFRGKHIIIRQEHGCAIHFDGEVCDAQELRVDIEPQILHVIYEKEEPPTLLIPSL